MFNVYPQRATNPKDLDEICNSEIHQQNIDIILQTIIEHNIKTLWLAYGDLIDCRPYLKSCLIEVLKSIKGLKLNYVIIQQLTQKGHPRHPLYKPAQSTFSEFQIVDYLSKINPDGL